jgi:hypothetical protein
MTKEQINHPPHYGGADNPFETIKVLQARLTPIEFMGFCKGNAYKYNDRAAEKGKIADFEKAGWYQSRLVEFAKEVGADTLFPPVIFWNENGETFDDSHELISCEPIGCLIAIHSNVAPHTTWAVRFHTSEDGDTDVDKFEVKDNAEAFLNRLLEADKPKRSHRRQKRGQRR